MLMLKPFEHKFKAFFFSMLKGRLRKRTPAVKPLDVSQIKRVIFFRQDRLGDMVVTLPIIDGLKKSFPHIDVSILASPKNLSLIKDDPRFENIYLYSKNLRQDWETIRHIKSQRFDCIVDTLFDDSVTGLFLSQYCSNGQPIIGIGKEKYREYYDYCFNNNSEHLIDTMLKILTAFGIDINKVSGFGGPNLSQQHNATADEFIKSFTPAGSYVSKIGINLSSGAPTRIWQEEKWIELIQKIQSFQPDYQIVLIALPSEREKASEIQKHFGKNIHIVPDRLDILGVSAILKRLDILITPDTSLVHIARGYQIPVVGLYSRHDKNFGLWHPFGMEHGAVRARAYDDIFDITVEQVTEKFLEILDAKQEVKQ